MKPDSTAVTGERDFGTPTESVLSNQLTAEENKVTKIMGRIRIYYFCLSQADLLNLSDLCGYNSRAVIT